MVCVSIVWAGLRVYMGVVGVGNRTGHRVRWGCMVDEVVIGGGVNRRTKGRVTTEVGRGWQ